MIPIGIRLGRECPKGAVLFFNTFFNTKMPKGGAHMNCKHCGAALPAGAERCEYCGAATPHAADNLEKILRQKKRAGLGSMKRVPGGMLFFLYVFSLGIYSGVWYMLRSNSLNRLYPRLRFPFWGACLHLCLVLAWFFLSQDEVQSSLGLSEEDARRCFNLLFPALGGLSIWLSFKARSILQNYAAQYVEKSVVVLSIAPSGLMTVFFGPLYLQLQVNKMIDMELLNPEL